MEVAVVLILNGVLGKALQKAEKNLENIEQKLSQRLPWHNGLRSCVAELVSHLSQGVLIFLVLC